MASLTISLDSLAMLKTITASSEPDPTKAAVLAELSGADGIAVQYRRDRRFIREKDLYLIKGICKSKFFIEMPPIEEAVKLAMELKPWMVIFVADHADSNAPVSPIDFNNPAIDFRSQTSQLEGLSIRSGFFVDPDPEHIKGAVKNGGSAVLINARNYTSAKTIDEARSELDRLEKAFATASKFGLEIYCGGDLDFKNIKPLIDMNIIDEFFVGHTIFARAIMFGIDKAVNEILSQVK